MDGRRAELQVTPAGRELLDRAQRRGELALSRLALDGEPARAGDLVAALADWIPALDAAAVRLRQVLERIEAS